MNALAVCTPAPAEGEILEPGAGATIVFSPSPFQRGAVKNIALPAGWTIDDAVRMTGVGPNLRKHLGVYLADCRIEEKYWRRIRPKPGAALFIRVELHGKKGKNPLRALLMIAVAVVATVIAGPIGAWVGRATGSSILGTVAKVAVTAAILTAGQALTNALIPPPKTSNSFGFDQQPGNPYAALTGIRNQFAPYAPIPRVIGKRRIYPMLAARPYTEMQGKTQYLRMLLLVGYGPLDISDIRIGNTAITSFAGAQVEVREGWENDSAVTLYTKQIAEEDLSILLTPSTPNVRTSDNGAQEISIDVTFPNGLATYDSVTGLRQNRTVSIKVEWSANAGLSWNNATWIEGSAAYGTGTSGQLNATAASASVEVRSGRFAVSGGTTYQVRLTRLTASGGTYVQDAAYWTILRSIKPDAPIAKAGLSLIALRLKATEQLNGSPDTINCIAHSYLPVYDGEEWEYQLSRSPAWGFADVLRRRGLTSMIGDSRIDLVGPDGEGGIKAWAEACAETAPNADEPRFLCDIVLEGGSVLSAAQLIASHGRAQLTVTDGKYSVARDIEQTIPVQHITPRNSSGYRGFKAFVDVPHAFRMNFYDKNRDYAQDEVIVYRDGYGETASEGVEAATKFDSLDLPGCTSSTQAWREGRYHFAQILLRPEEHTVSMDIEAIRCTKGDLVSFSHDVLSIGQATGRIGAIEMGVDETADKIVAVYLDSEIEMEAETDYALRVRGADLTTTLHPVVTEAGITNRVELVTPVEVSGAGPFADQLYSFGVLSHETAPMLVKSISRGDDFSAQLTLVAAQSGVYTADTGTIPAFETNIQRSMPISQVRPAAPTLTLRSDETALQRLSDMTLVDRIEVSHALLASSDVVVTKWEVEFRRSGTDGDWDAVRIERFGVPIYINPVVQGELYDVRARFISRDGFSSDWTVEEEHEVVGKTTPPSAPTDFEALATINGVRFDWTISPELDVDGYDIRVGGSDWDSATPLVSAVRGPQVSIPYVITGFTTFRIKAYDVLGLYSDEDTAGLSSVLIPTYAGNAAAISGGLGPGDLFYDSSDDNTLRAVTASGLIVTISPYLSTKTRSGAGTLTSDTFTVSVSGGSGSYTYRWEQSDGDAMTINSPNSSSSTISTVLGVGENHEGLFRVVVVDTTNGKSGDVHCTYNATETS